MCIGNPSACGKFWMKVDAVRLLPTNKIVLILFLACFIRFCQSKSFVNWLSMCDQLCEAKNAFIFKCDYIQHFLYTVLHSGDYRVGVCVGSNFKLKKYGCKNLQCLIRCNSVIKKSSVPTQKTIQGHHIFFVIYVISILWKARI